MKTETKIKRIINNLNINKISQKEAIDKIMEIISPKEDSYMEIQASDYVADEEEGEVITDSYIIEELSAVIHDAFYYGNFWHKLNGGYCNVEDIGVVDLGDKYKVFAHVQHGQEDECGKQSYTDYPILDIRKDNYEIIKMRKNNETYNQSRK